jgi:hypothetical protein
MQFSDLPICKLLITQVAINHTNTQGKKWFYTFSKHHALHTATLSKVSLVETVCFGLYVCGCACAFEKVDG